MIKSLFLVLLIFGSLNFLFADTSCVENRAAFDIGSGSVKIMVAKINFCQNKIEQIFLNDNRKVGFKSDLEKSKDNSFSEQILIQGVNTLGELKKLAEEYHPKKYLGVATAAFRTAKNGAEFINRIDKELNIQAKIITQDEEAILGYKSLISMQSYSGQKRVMVWDIGGGSQQITVRDGRGKYFIYKGNIASVGFKNRVISEILKKDFKIVNSPNPLGEKNAKKALALAFNLAKRDLNQKENHEILKLVKNSDIYGIGGVHSSSILKQLKDKNANEYTLSNLENLLKEQALKSDSEIGDEYAATDVTNLILVAGFMKALKINQVKVEKINLTTGLILE